MLMHKIVLVSVLISIAISFKPCQPFGPRVFYGDSVADPSSPNKLTIYFNTVDSCYRSYLLLVRKSGFVKVPCETTSLSLSKQTNNYNTSVHRCSTDQLDWQQHFHYNVFGVDNQGNSMAYGDFIPLRLANPFNKDRQMNWIVLADWCRLVVNKDRYKALDPLMEQVQEQQQINGIIINGDVGYDLDTNNCSNYQKFMVMLAETCPSLPVLIITGNHQYNTQDNWKLYAESFKLYGLDIKNVTGITMGAMYLVLVDPYNAIYEAGTRQVDPVFEEMDKLLKKTRGNGQFVITFSHYPLICSGPENTCASGRTNMKDYWQSMLQNDVSLYLGAHWHSYQRMYPYFPNNDTFLYQQGDYSSDRGYLVTIVEGVAGNDQDIAETLPQIKKETASYTLNETGFGVMEVSGSTSFYRHLTTSRGQVDKVAILIKGSYPKYHLKFEEQ